MIGVRCVDGKAKRVGVRVCGGGVISLAHSLTFHRVHQPSDDDRPHLHGQLLPLMSNLWYISESVISHSIERMP